MDTERRRPSLRVLSNEARRAVVPELLEPIEYRKSGLSLNHIIGCPLNCAYCVRHLFGNFGMKQPHALMSDEEAVERLVNHHFFQRDRTPLQVFNRATDPFLPDVKPHTLRVLQLLADRGLRNHILVITRYVVEKEDAKALNDLGSLRVTLLATYSGIDDTRIEPTGWGKAIQSLKTAYEISRTFRTILYWRPIIAGLNDSEAHIARAISFSRFAHATVFTGLFYGDVIQEHYRSESLPEPYETTARRKILPRALEAKILAAFGDAKAGPLFRKTSCAVASVHGEADYNGHYGIAEICDICPRAQVARCRACFGQPDADAVARLAAQVGTDQTAEIGERAIVFDALDEQRRYFIQHALGYQVHDRRHPHHHRQHGRAPIGWEASEDDD